MTTLAEFAEEAATAESIKKELDRAYEDHSALRVRVFNALFPYQEHGNLVKHAINELTLAGMYERDADYGPGAIAANVLDLMAVFASQGHSGGSAGLVRDLFTRLANYETLSPNDHSQNHDVSKESGTPPGTTLQDTRDSRWFSNDGGKTWRNVDQHQ